MAKVAVGGRFGRWEVLVSIAGSYGQLWWCLCGCGTVRPVVASNLTRKLSKSCGCLKKELATKHSATHGKSKTRLYRIWIGMRGRCNNCNQPSFRYYGGCGIKVCVEWEEFSVFQKWALESGYTDSLSIERRDVAKDYSPENCCWIPRNLQAKNTRRTRWVVVDGVRMSFSDAARLHGVDPNLAQTRLHNLGWDETRAYSQAPDKDESVEKLLYGAP